MKGYIFDLDGTVLDSMGVWRNIDVEFLGRRGLEFTEEYAKALSSMKLGLAAEYTINLYGLNESADDIIKEWLDAARREFKEKVGLKAYARELLEALKEKGIPMAVATTSQKELYMPALERNGILEYFDVIVDSDMVTKGKESPEIFLAAAKALGLEPWECMVFEDTAAGIRSAKSAGFTVAAVLDELQETEHPDIKEIADRYGADFKEFWEEVLALKQ